jgi:hypothetical protein
MTLGLDLTRLSAKREVLRVKPLLNKLYGFNDHFVSVSFRECGMNVPECMDRSMCKGRSRA